ncbi:MAG: S8 family serine peptidase [Candidatus Zixiibacteriota bacterium]
MKTFTALALIGILFFCALSVSMAGAAVVEIENEFVAKLQNGVNPADVWPPDRAGIQDSIPGMGIFLVEYLPGTDKADILDTLAKNPFVEFAEPNYLMEFPENFQMSISFPDESRPTYLMGVSPESFYTQPADYDLGITQAQLLSTGAGVTVAVIDNGLDFNHPMFAAANLIPGRDIIDNDNDPTDEGGSAYGHGTFVTGLILLAAPDCNILPIKAFDGDGIGTSFDAARAIRWAATHGADVINMSFGMEIASAAIEDAIDFTKDRDVIMIAASGNESLTVPIYPAAFPGVLAVSAIDEDEYIAEFSNYGNFIDVCAPGVNLYSALAGEYNWGTWSGTSFSAPLVAAGCAMAKAENPDISAGEMIMHVRSTARRELDWGLITPPSFEYGNGCIDIYELVSTIHDFDGVACGDADGNGIVNPADANYIVRFVFKGGKPPVSMRAADVNCDNSVNQADATYLLNYLIKNGTPPCCIFK